jgi:hypothetical protein
MIEGMALSGELPESPLTRTSVVVIFRDVVVLVSSAKAQSFFCYSVKLNTDIRLIVAGGRGFEINISVTLYPVR